jgi:hypothetical protein
MVTIDNFEYSSDSAVQAAYVGPGGAIMGEGWYKDVGDCLSYSKDEFDKLSKEDIEAEKGKRVEARIIQVKMPIPIYEPTPEDLDREIEAKQMDLAILTARKTDLVATLQAKPIEEVIKE